MRTQPYPTNQTYWRVYRQGNHREYRKILAGDRAEAKFKGAQIFQCAEREIVASKVKASKP